MLTCAIIVWMLQPIEWSQYIHNNHRELHLTEAGCYKKNNNKEMHCKKIDKRIDLTFEEWEKDVCSLSEHRWVGQKN